MCDTEECQKLVTASINWFKTAEQVDSPHDGLLSAILLCKL